MRDAGLTARSALPLGAVVLAGCALAGCAAPSPAPRAARASALAPASAALPPREEATGEPRDAAPAPTSSAAAPPDRSPNAAAPPEPPPIPRGTAVLHIGDSFTLAGFAQALKPRMKALGVRYEVRAETSSYTTGWAAKMELVVANTQPDLVIITLGANEVGNPKPESHAYAVRNLVRAIGGRPCVWVSPPLWRKDTGMVEVIRENSAPCRFFDSDALVGKPIPRQSDHIHPTPEGGAIWADAFWAWLMAQRAREPVVVGGKARPWALVPSPPDEHRPREPVAGLAP